MTDTTTTLPDVIVVGVRAKKNTEIDIPFEQQDEVPEGENPDGGIGGGYATQAEVDAENQRQKDCAGTKAADEIKNSPLSNLKEWFSHIFKHNDMTAYHAPRGGTGAGIAPSTFDAARAEFGISPWDVIGMVHNHPADEYCAGDPNDPNWQAREVGFNQYPSENDWAYAEQMVTAGGYNGSDFTLYIVGCDGVTRSFPYNQMSTYRPLVQPTNMQTAPVPALQAPVAADC